MVTINTSAVLVASLNLCKNSCSPIYWSQVGVVTLSLWMMASSDVNYDGRMYPQVP